MGPVGPLSQIYGEEWRDGRVNAVTEIGDLSGFHAGLEGGILMKKLL